MPITEERPCFILNLKINDLINGRYSTAVATSRNFYGWLRLNMKTASAGAAQKFIQRLTAYRTYGGLWRLRGLEVATLLMEFTCHTGSHSVNLPPGRGDIPAFTAAEAGTRFSDPDGCKAEFT